MNLLVTGGAGFVGSVLVPMLLTNDHRVTVVDNFMFGQTSLNGLCLERNFDVVRADVRDKAKMAPLIRKADVILPLAALVGAPLCDADPETAVAVNLDAVRDMSLSRDQRVIIPITNSGYGIGKRGEECTEDSPLRPVSLYGRTKVAAEAAMLERPNSISLRFATLFGMSPRMRLDLLVNDFVWRAVTDRAVVLFEADFKRNYLHVFDAARAFVWALGDFEKMAGRAYNVGLSDANLSKRELCERIAKHVPEFTYLEAPVGKDPDQRDYLVSNARIEATGWKPVLSLDDGIAELIKGYRMLRRTAYGNV